MCTGGELIAFKVDIIHSLKEGHVMDSGSNMPQKWMNSLIGKTAAVSIQFSPFALVEGQEHSPPGDISSSTFTT